MPNRLMSIALVIGLAQAAGCEDNGNGRACACDTSADCPRDLICDEDCQCSPRPCSTDDDCDVYHFCDRGYCRPISGDSDNDTDVDSDLDSDTDVDTDGDTDQGVTRSLAERTNGFCFTEGQVDDSCTSADDCVGYRIPFPVACCPEDPPPAWEESCAFANRAAFPDSPECTADLYCRKVPRACIDGRCVPDPPAAGCADSTDCRLFDTGCECVAAAVSVEEYRLAYGEDCSGMTSCADDAQAVCVEGLCYVAGSFLDDLIDRICEWSVDCCETYPNLCTVEPGQGYVEECIREYRADDYAKAARGSEVLRSVDVAQDCLAWMTSIGREAFECINVLCD